MPTANAMSVAIGIAHPCAPGPRALKAAYRRAGTAAPPAGGRDRQDGRALPGKLPREEFAFDLEPHEEKEDRHEPVVDGVEEGRVEGQHSDVELHREMGGVRVGFAQSRVREDEGEYGRHEEHDAGGGFGPQKLLKRPQRTRESPDRRHVARWIRLV